MTKWAGSPEVTGVSYSFRLAWSALTLCLVISVAQCYLLAAGCTVALYRAALRELLVGKGAGCSRGCRQKSLLQIITARSWQMAKYDAVLLA